MIPRSINYMPEKSSGLRRYLASIEVNFRSILSIWHPVYNMGTVVSNVTSKSQQNSL